MAYMKIENPKRIVLAYSGGLDTSVILHWLKKEYGSEIITFCADIGQEEDLSEVNNKALKTGAIKSFVFDLKEEFAKDYVFPMIRGSAVYEMRYLLGTSIARPLIAKKHVEVALQENADAVSHGATGKGNDQVRFELGFAALAPHLKIIAPWRTWAFKGRQDLIDYAQKEGIPITATAEKPYSIDANLLHTSFEGGILENPWFEPKEDMFLKSKSPENAPNKATYVEITFNNGNAVAVDGEPLTPAQVLIKLNHIAGENGVGRVDIVENRLVGIKSRGVYETPGGTLLHAAHRDLESITIERDLQHLKDELSIRYAQLVYNGKWFSPEREALQAFIDTTQTTVNGVVRLKLFKGSFIVVGRKADKSLYDSALASFEAEEVYNQFDAEGFLRLYGLPIKNFYSTFRK